MSSNIEIERICQHCNKDFIARTTVTRFCSDDCAKRAYKVRKREEKIGLAKVETQRIRRKPIEELKDREFLTVIQVSKLLGCSKQNIYKLINSGKLKATNIMIKKTLIRRSEIDRLFEPKIKKEVKNEKLLNPKDCYTISEVQNKFKVSQTALQKIISRNKIQKMQKGKFVYVSKDIIDNIFK